MTAAAEELGYPVVIEVPDRTGERGVGLARDREAVARAAADALAESSGEYCLVEELVGGRIVTVNAFSLAGRFVPLTVTDREQAPPPAFGVSLAHLWPAELEPAEVGAAVETAARRGAGARHRARADDDAGPARRGWPAAREAVGARRRRARRRALPCRARRRPQRSSPSPPRSGRDVHAQQLAP